MLCSFLFLQQDKARVGLLALNNYYYALHLDDYPLGTESCQLISP